MCVERKSVAKIIEEMNKKAKSFEESSLAFEMPFLEKKSSKKNYKYLQKNSEEKFDDLEEEYSSAKHSYNSKIGANIKILAERCTDSPKNKPRQSNDNGNTNEDCLLEENSNFFKEIVRKNKVKFAEDSLTETFYYKDMHGKNVKNTSKNKKSRDYRLFKKQKPKDIQSNEYSTYYKSKECGKETSLSAKHNIKEKKIQDRKLDFKVVDQKYINCKNISYKIKHIKDFYESISRKVLGDNVAMKKSESASDSNHENIGKDVQILTANNPENSVEFYPDQTKNRILQQPSSSSSKQIKSEIESLKSFICIKKLISNFERKKI